VWSIRVSISDLAQIRSIPRNILTEFSEDCAPGTCYEGACPGDKVYSTDDTCGYYHRNRLCAGKWGECCNFDGKCGSGEDFCSQETCQLGKRIRPMFDHSPLSWLLGNTH
jgi:hypothetical protein